MFCPVYCLIVVFWWKKKKVREKSRECQQSQAAALPRHQEEEETDETKTAQIDKRMKSIKISSLFSKQHNRNAQRNEKHKNKKTPPVWHWDNLVGEEKVICFAFLWFVALHLVWEEGASCFALL